MILNLVLYKWITQIDMWYAKLFTLWFVLNWCQNCLQNHQFCRKDFSAMSQEKIPHFRTAITAIFKNWTALQLAVNHVSCSSCWKLSWKFLLQRFSHRMLVVRKARRKLNGWRNPLKPGSMRTKTLSHMRYRYPLILTCTKIHIFIGGGVLGWHHWSRIPAADWWWILERGV